MKAKTLILVVLLSFISTLIFAKDNKSANVYKNSINREFKVAPGATLSINNRYGNITIGEAGGNIVNILVEIEIESKKGDPEAVKDIVNIDFKSSPSLVSATTVLALRKEVNNDVNFKINYTITAPKYINLEIANKYGNTLLSEVGGRLNADISYGDIDVLTLDSDAKVILKYGDISVNSAKNITLDAGYAKVNFRSVVNFDIISKYSKVAISKVDKLNISETKYDDYVISSLSSLNCISAAYTKFNIDDIKRSFVIPSARYCNISTGLCSSFIEYRVDASYTPINIYLDENASFKCSLSSRYADVKMIGFGDINSISKNGSSVSMNHSVGSNSSKSSMNVTNSYGNIVVTSR